MIIDFHTHVFPDELAGYAMEKLSRNCGVKYSGTATPEGLMDTMKKCGVDKSVVLHIATKESQHEDILRFAKEIDSDSLISFGSVKPDSQSALEYIWKISDEGLKGIKFHPHLQRMYPDEKKYFPLYDLARALNLVVTFHTGWDPSYPHELQAPPSAIARIAKNFPGLRIVAAHLGGLKLAHDVFMNVAGAANIYMDTAYCADKWLDKRMFEDIIRKHGADKILFGSDYPWHLPSQELGLIRSLDISDEERDMILGGNAVRLLGL